MASIEMCDEISSSGSTDQSTSINDLNLTYFSSLDKEQKSGLKIIECNLEGIIRKFEEIHTTLKRKGLAVKEIQSNAKTITNLKSKSLVSSKHNCEELAEVIIKINEMKKCVENNEMKISNLKSEIESLKQKQNSDYENLKLKIGYLKNVITTVESNFNIKMTVECSNEIQTVVLLKFENKYPVQVTFDNSNKILDFNASSVCTELEQNELKDWFKSDQNPTKLIVKLRNYVLKKQQES